MEHYIFSDLLDFNLENTLTCGQCFRWHRQGNGHWHGIVGNQYADVWTEGESLHIISGQDQSFWREYFDLGADYARYRERIRAAHPFLWKASGHAHGIRILRQDGWETLATFILSQNNNIPRITGIIERLCQHFGEEQGRFQTFPTAEMLAVRTPEELSPIRAGFRAKYLVDAARRVSDGAVDLEKCGTCALAAAREELVKIYGVGEKVAECTLLFGFHRLDAFPVDVWMARAMARYLPEGLPKEIADIAGVAQQYIFHYMRTQSGEK